MRQILTAEKGRQLKEAADRMDALELEPYCKDRLTFEGKTFWTLQTFQGGFLYWDDNDSDDLDKKVKDAIDKYEREHPDDLIYHSIVVPTEFGTICYILSVEKDKGDWEFEKCKKDNGKKFFYTYAYADNLDHPEFSEYGEIAIAPFTGGAKVLM